MTIRHHLSAGLLVAASCGLSVAAFADDMPKLNFAGSVTWIGQVPILVAVENGFFTDKGLDVGIEVIVSSADRIRAIASGDAAFSNLGRVAVITEMARGNDAFVYFANVDDSPGREGCWAQPDVADIAALKGRPVAANSSAEITLSGILADHGMSLSDVEYLNLPATEMAAAMSHGDVAAACVWEPLLTRLKEAVPDGKLLGTDMDTEIYREFGTSAAGDIVIISRELVEEHPEQASALAAAVLEGADYAISHPQEAAAAVAHYFKMTPEEMLAAIEGFRFYGSEGWKEHLDKHQGQMQYLADMLYKAGRIPTSPDSVKWMDTSFVTVKD